MGEAEKVGYDKPRGYNINDNADLLAEILGRLDCRSLCAAACVCRLWGAVSRKDTVWEALCNRHVSSYAATDSSFPGTRTVVAALGGYRRLYRRCVGPIFDRLAAAGDHEPHSPAAAAAARLSLSLFSIDCYERLCVGGRQPPPSSLLFLGSAVDVT